MPLICFTVDILEKNKIFHKILCCEKNGLQKPIQFFGLKEQNGGIQQTTFAMQ